jgi:hypothetical protein
MKLLIIFCLIFVVSATNRCGGISRRHENEMIRCVERYWEVQAGTRSNYSNIYVENCMNENIVAAPFGVDSIFGKQAVLSGWRKVSTNVIDMFGVDTGPYFENNTDIDIGRTTFSCSNDVPTVDIALRRYFYYNATGESSYSYYKATFIFTKSSDRGRSPAHGAPDYTIIRYEYQPFASTIVDLWPGAPLRADKYHIFLMCSLLELRCGDGLVWTPYRTCTEWMLNHPHISAEKPYSPTFVEGTGYCVFQIAFFGTTKFRSSDPFINLCPFLPFCTGTSVRRNYDMSNLSSYLI